MFVIVDAVVYYNIRNPMDAVCKIENYANATKLLSATTLRLLSGIYFLSRNIKLSFKERPGNQDLV